MTADEEAASRKRVSRLMDEHFARMDKLPNQFDYLAKEGAEIEAALQARAAKRTEDAVYNALVRYFGPPTREETP